MMAIDRNKCTKYTHRILARFILKAETALAIGSGEDNIFTDSAVAKDVNNLPYIPGTSIAGILRNVIDSSEISFGTHEDGGKGSEIIFTEGKILNTEGNAVDGLDLNAFNDNLLKNYQSMPIRQHVSISDKGVARDTGKFDNEVVFAGTRFVFEIEILSDTDNKDKNKDKIEAIIKAMYNEIFCIGGGTRKGYGQVRLEEAKYRELDLTTTEHLDLYLGKPSNLNESATWSGWEQATETIDRLESCGWEKFEIKISPEDFIFFGSGYGDESCEYDNTPVREQRVEQNEEGKYVLSDIKKTVLIPASSLKGALRHRTIYHYNRIKHRFANGLTPAQIKELADNCEASNEIFGYVDGDKKGLERKQTRGKALFFDISRVEENEIATNKFTHVRIDGFTGGAIDGALYSEKVDNMIGSKAYSTAIYVQQSALDKDPDVKQAFTCAIDDLITGKLPLGGMTNRGHGVINRKNEN